MNISKNIREFVECLIIRSIEKRSDRNGMVHIKDVRDVLNKSISAVEAVIELQEGGSIVSSDE